MSKDKTNYEHVTWKHLVASFVWPLLMTPYLPIFLWNFYGLGENHLIFSRKIIKK